MIKITELKFDKDGLIPAIITDHFTGAVLMLAYMNAESLQISMEEGKTCFWSRSRRELWRKGASSGNVQHIVSIKTDCDKDALTISVKKDGPACHTGSETCFFEDVYGSAHDTFTLDSLYKIVTNRQTTPKPGSYTNYLFEKGIDKILKKFGEEATEVIIAAKGDDKGETIYELSDLVFHAMVLMAQMGITPDDIKKELASRHVKDAEDSVK